MEIKISTSQILKALYILSWIIFVGLCIEAGSVIVSTIARMVLDPSDAQKFWQKVDLSSLYAFDPVYFLIEATFISIVILLKAVIFYLIIKFLQDKKLDMTLPFSKELRRFISNIAYLTFFIGLLSAWGNNYSKWFVQQGVIMPDTENMSLDGADVWIFMSVILLVIAQIFKRGIEIQSENELTI